MARKPFGVQPIGLLAAVAGTAFAFAAGLAGADERAAAAPERARVYSTGPGAPQQSVDGIVLDAPRESAPRAVIRSGGVRVVSTGDKGPVSVGHVGCPGCLEFLRAIPVLIEAELPEHGRRRGPRR